MTAADFRRLALALPGVAEGSHMGHADFRIHGKIFATLGARPGCGMVKLMPADQAHLMRAHPKIFSPATGRGERAGVRWWRSRRREWRWCGKRCWRRGSDGEVGNGDRLMRSATAALLGAILCATNIAAQQRTFVADSAWMPIRIDHPMRSMADNPDSEQGPNILHFRNGHRLTLDLVGAQFLGQLPRRAHAPYLLLGGRGCYACDIETQVYVVPADADSLGLPPDTYSFPGTLAPGDPDEGPIFYRGRLFIGRCLADRRPTAVWFESQRDSTGRWQPDVYRLDPTADTARGRFLRPRPALRTTLAAVKAGACYEVPGIDDTEG